MGKCILAKVNKFFLLSVTIIQFVLAATLGIKAIINKDFSYLGIFLMIFAIGTICCFAFKKNRAWLLVALYIFTFPTVFDAAASSDTVLCLPGRPQGTIDELMMQRFVWPHVSEIGYSYGLDVLEDNKYIELAISPETLWTDLFPAIEAAYGSYTPQIYKRYVSLSMESMKSSVIPELISDCAKYVFSPFVSELSLLGIVGNVNGDDFERVIDRLGMAGWFYYHFGFAGFVGLIVLWLANHVVYKEKIGKKTTITSVALIGIFTLYNVFFPLRGYDYNKAVWITVIYCLYFCLGLRRLNADN